YTISKICDVKSTVGYTVIPYTVALFPSAIWLYYGGIRSNAITLVIINNTGCIIEMAYVVIFFYYSGNYDKIPNIILLVLGIGQIVVYVIFRTPQTSETTGESQTAKTI
ncbi:PREDICTED: bidirectional sugar transporter NEC1-like, partial [Erythranthe guttata]|uniref:bidirectional sugar transporter NEC1-like n=1 Tax=Erythranthe guttata TaxID=4155 RepID=UPI00064DAF82